MRHPYRREAVMLKKHTALLLLPAIWALVLGGFFTPEVRAQDDEEPVSEPEVQCESLIGDQPLVSSMPPFAILGVNLIEHTDPPEDEDVFGSRLDYVDVVIFTDVVQGMDLTDPATREYMDIVLPTIEWWADGRPQSDDQNGQFFYTVPSPNGNRSARADRPLRARPMFDSDLEVLGDPPPNSGGDYLLPGDPSPWPGGPPTDDLQAIYDVAPGGAVPLIYRFQFGTGDPSFFETFLRADDGEYAGNDIFLVVQLSSEWPAGGSISAGIWDHISPNPPRITSEYMMGVHTTPVDLISTGDGAFEGCVPEDPVSPTVNNTMMEYQYGTRTLSKQPYETIRQLPPNFNQTEGWNYSYREPRIMAMDDPHAVIQIWANGGTDDDRWYVDRLTVTLTDIGGGNQFGRTSAESYRGDGGFNPLTGLEPFSGKSYGFRGVELWRDQNNSGRFEPDQDAVYVSTPQIMAIVPGDPYSGVILDNFVPTFPYVYIRDPDPFNGVPDDPEWTICLNIRRSVILPEVTPQKSSNSNVDNVALDVDPETPRDLPDLFVVVRADSGYVDTDDAAGFNGADFNSVNLGADFRAFIKPEIMVNTGKLGKPLDPLNAFAQQAVQAQDVENFGDYQFPGGLLLSIQNVASGGMDAAAETALLEESAPPISIAANATDLVMEYPGRNIFSKASGPWETVPFFLPEDVPATEFGTGPRSEAYPIPPSFPFSSPPGTVSSFVYDHVLSSPPPAPPSLPTTIIDTERNFFADRMGHRIMSERIDSSSGERLNNPNIVPTPILGINLANSADPRVTQFNELYVTQIDLAMVSRDAQGRDTGFQPSDLLPLSPNGLGASGITLWLDNPSSGAIGRWDPGDTQLEMVDFQISDTPQAIEVDGIHQDYNGDGQPDYFGVDRDGDGIPDDGLDIIGYPVTARFRQNILVPHDDYDPSGFPVRGDSDTVWGGDDIFVCITTSDTISYQDRIECVLSTGLAPSSDNMLSLVPHGIHYQPDNISDPSVYIRREARLGARHTVYPNGYGSTSGVYSVPDYLPFDRDISLDPARTYGITQLRANVPVELHDLVQMRDTNNDLVPDAQPLPKNSGPVPVLGLDMATLNTQTAGPVYLEQLIVEFYPDEQNNSFSLDRDLLPFTTDSFTSGIGLWRDVKPDDIAWREPDENGENGSVQGAWDPFDIPLAFDDPPDVTTVSGQVTAVRMVFSSPGTYDSDDNFQTAEPDPPAPVYGDSLRQRVRDTFGRNEFGLPIPGDPDAGTDFFVTLQTSDRIEVGDNFRVGIMSWGPDTPTGPDPDEFSWPPPPWPGNDHYKMFLEFPFGSRAIGFIETPLDPLDPQGLNSAVAGFDFLRTSSSERIVSSPLAGGLGVGTGPIGGEMTITDVFPSTLAEVTPANATQIVSISGTGFPLDTTQFVATIGDVVLHALSSTGNLIVAEVPAGSTLTDGTVKVTAGSNVATWDGQITIVSAAPPTISSITPSSGIAGISVSIVGSGFDDNAQVYFSTTPSGGLLSPTTTVDSLNRITATVPNGVPGPQYVRVENPNTGLVAISVPVPDGTGAYTGGFVLLPGQQNLTPAAELPSIEGETLINDDECVLPMSYEIPLAGINVSFNPVDANGLPL
ncbi:MAG: IPT/TIG domain-containing protein, partial [Candidatus Hydrogenedentes bacterium]|nr:IPT/TIG domain-containing protein [Candidatus Hydrogenedentota bacterium]